MRRANAIFVKVMIANEVTMNAIFGKAVFEAEMIYSDSKIRSLSRARPAPALNRSSKSPTVI